MFESQEDFDKQFPRSIDNPYSPEQLATTKSEKITGWHPQGPVPMPVSYLLGVKGRMNEHQRDWNDPRFDNHVNELADSMRQNGYDPKKPVALEFDNNGDPWMYEGNHRIHAAHKAGLEYIPTDIKYLGGAERKVHPFSIHQQYQQSKAKMKPTAVAKDVQKYKHNKPWYVVQHPGKPTAKHTKLVALPLDYLLTLPGMRDEHKVLTFETPKVRRMVDICSDREWQRENPVTLNVLNDGRVIIEDGNHRIRAAKLGGCKSFLCKVVYYGGGEEHFDLGKILDKYASLDVVAYLQVLCEDDKLKTEARGFGSPGPVKVCSGKNCNKRPVGMFCDDCYAKKNEPGFEIKKPEDYEAYRGRNAAFQGISGDGEVDGETADGEYAEMHDAGVDYGGEHDPNKDDERTMIPGQTDGKLAALEALHMFAKYAASCDEPRFSDKEHRQHDHIKESEEEQGKSEEEADDIAWATVNKQKHEAAVMAPVMPGAAPKPSFWDRLKPHHQNIIHNLMNQLYTPGVDDVNPEPDQPMWGNNPPGSRVADLFRAALASDEVLEALVQIAESTNKPCVKCGSPARPCLCTDGTAMSPGYTQSGTQRKNNPVKTKSSLPKEMNPNKSLGKL